MEKLNASTSMSFEELVNMIKSLVMFINTGCDASSDFDNIAAIGMTLGIMKSKFELEHTLKNNYRTHMIEEFKKRKELQEKLQKINQESSGI